VIERIAIDTSAAVDYIRDDRQSPPPIDASEEVVLPLPVLGELFYGAFKSNRLDQNLSVLELLMKRWPTLRPDTDTARIYGELRSKQFPAPMLSSSKLNDLWIAALCIQHDLALLTNDAGFDHIARLNVIHW
jgi:tRNA(fMet)-specific endonuclease VapC